MWGTADRVVSREGHEMLVGLCGSADAELRTYAGGRHNLLAEPSLAADVAADIRAFVLARAGARAT
jgi:alpha-beta hydrolase superfamily lysophospholipase